MSPSPKHKSPVPFAQLASRVLGPVAAKRGFAKADLVAAWDEVAGPRYAAVTQPDTLKWPRDGEGGGVLTVRVAGASAVLLQHESEQFLARVNSFLGYGAVAQLKIVQRPLDSSPKSPRRKLLELTAEQREAVEQTVADVESDSLREALARLGTAVAAESLARE